ncbi:MAG TPA: rhomboid family intramembrane serine protease, partial [Bacilli bacterium]|nr:rhomboid family intramembrane serine protease [Bacilli bacterium]
VFSEKGNDLFKKINKDILNKNTEVNKQVNDIFSKKKVIITYILIGINMLIFILMYLYGRGSTDIATLYYFGGLIKGGSLTRTLTSIFLHVGILHLLLNCYSLYIIGNEIENFYGKTKLIYIYLFSGIVGNLVSIIFMSDSTISAGASGAIFGLIGALLYFALNYRVYFGEAIKSQIIPVILINLMLGMLISNVNSFAHIGGLIGGILAAITVGIKNKTSRFEKINGLITSIILVGMLLYFIYK